MGPNLSEDEIDDLIYLARTGDDAELTSMLQELVARENVTCADILEATRDDGKATCLHMAAANGHAKTVTLLLSYFPITTKASRRQSQEVEKPTGTAEAAATAEATAPEPPYINAYNTFGNTALHWACLGGHLATVKLLLSRGADPAAVNDKEQIPLDLAAFNNHMHVVEYFLAQSRDIEGDNVKEGGLEGVVRDVSMNEGEEGGKGEETGAGG
ncbi:ankyrin [Hypoxylon fragiforme]|uniref:ankyrin n=1 Tax=Hypoxylon fragiforme TaxID=63214 RepID=UPI0020C73DD1|nr:ankyrin [Hypoxylon fragiforme]KAI2608127.1 ankyrin [Hypoxylon fragiforme]